MLYAFVIILLNANVNYNCLAFIFKMNYYVKHVMIISDSNFYFCVNNNRDLNEKFSTLFHFNSQVLFVDFKSFWVASLGETNFLTI